MPFTDRSDAGRRLAELLLAFRGEDVVVLGLPRGGVPVAAEVAEALGAPLDVILVRKLGVPFQPELAMGALGEGGVVVLNDRVIHSAHVTSAELASVKAREEAELDRRSQLLRQGRPAVPLEGRTAVVVDDGMATGATARAACRVARAHGAGRVILAVPVASPEAVEDLGREVEVVCAEVAERLWVIGQWYRDFTQVSDDEVVRLLSRAAAAERVAASATAGADPAPDPSPEEVVVEAGDTGLPGFLVRPAEGRGLVLFAHGSGSSRHSPRNRYVATVLAQSGLGTLLFDLLTPTEEQSRANVFDIGLLAARLNLATRWAGRQPGLEDAPVGYFGASTGAAAALWAAADPRAEVAAVVSRGGRPDLAGPQLAHVHAPTLLIVGGEDRAVLELNRMAQDQLRCESRLSIVPGATHLFEEPGTLSAAAELARDWFVERMAPVAGASSGRSGGGAHRGPR